MITRDKAGEAIYRVINSCILEDGLQEDLEDICTCILSEKDGVHLWGADDKEVGELYTSVRSDLITPEYEQHMNELYKKYAFAPSDFEEADFAEEVEEVEEEEKNNESDNTTR